MNQETLENSFAFLFFKLVFSIQDKYPDIFFGCVHLLGGVGSDLVQRKCLVVFPRRLEYHRVQFPLSVQKVNRLLLVIGRIDTSVIGGKIYLVPVRILDSGIDSEKIWNYYRIRDIGISRYDHVHRRRADALRMISDEPAEAGDVLVYLRILEHGHGCGVVQLV